LYFYYVFSGVLDLLGIGLIVSFISLLQNNSPIYQSEYWEMYLELIRTRDVNTALIYLGLGIVVVYLAKNIIAYSVQRSIVKLSWNLMVDLRIELLQKFQLMGYEEHIKKNSSFLITVIQTHVQQFAKGTVAATLKFFSEATIFSFIYLALLYNYFYVVCTISFVLFAIVVMYDRCVRSKLEIIGEKVSVTSTKLIEGVQTVIGAFKEVRVLGKEEYFHKEVTHSFKSMAEASVSMNAIQLLPRYALEALLVFTIVMTAVVSISQGVEKATIMTTLSIFALSGMRMLPAVSQVISAIMSIRYSSKFVLALHDELYSETIETLKANMDNSHSRKFETLTFDDVSFKYSGSSKRAIDNIYFTIKRGDVVGVKGPSGAGKSTLINILLGLLEPNDGDVIVNGKSIFEDLGSWYQSTAYIPQKVRFLDDSLRKNIAFGVPEDQINNDKVLAAMEQAALSDILTSLPNGIEADIGENGQLLSGGQQQRVALARSFYFDRQVVILDEATSALDEETENRILATILSMRGDKTFIIIAHRPSIMAKCDYLLDVSNGSFVVSNFDREIS
ncbi:ABC transporter ATP-binding protein/permease, partial [Alphaproteobacteria bacterium]|nr:ABC transporter ATP-binding protein/permease [Alphaproteobacteria bacterium]